jgi:DNA-directed RNA polymerase subunit RPC12/RpoP
MTYYKCPECGFKQKSEAVKRIRCHRCGRSYLRRRAKVVEKKPDSEVGTGFVKYSRKDREDS